MILMLLCAPAVTLAGSPAFDDQEANVESYMLLDMETGEVLAERNPDARIYPSSTTKLMTALLLLETKGLGGEITVGAEVNGFGESSSLMGLKQNETLSVSDVFYGMMVCSGNDAANALAVYIAGGLDEFAAMMNERARELGMENTNFINAHGLFLNPSEEIPEKDLGKHHYTTAADMAKLSMEAVKHPEITDAGKVETYTLGATNMHSEERQIEQSNRLTYVPERFAEEYGQCLYAPATGLKTGYIVNIRPEADGDSIPYYGCLVATAEQDGTSLLAVIFGDYTEKAKERWSLARALFEFGFNNFKKVDIGQYIQPVALREQVTGCAENDPDGGMLSISSVARDELPGAGLIDLETAAGLDNGSIVVERDIQLTRSLVAPISQGEEMGTVTYRLNGADIYSASLVADRKIFEAGAEQELKEADPGAGDPPSVFNPLYLLFIIIPAGAVGALFVVRHLNISRRGTGRRYAAGSARRMTATRRNTGFYERRTRTGRSTRGRY
jgi:D-alanyl-D-alanine carboxypeptidase